MWISNIVIGLVGIALISSGLGAESADANTSSARSLETSPAHATFERHSGGSLRARDALLYVADQANDIITVYDLSEPGYPVVQQIASGLSGIGVIYLDSNATLYVGNGNTKSVTVYPFGAKQPVLSLTDGVTTPAGIAVLADGTVYAAGRGSPALVEIYPPGQSSPSKSIEDPLISVPSQAIVDSLGNVYIADNSTGVYEIPAGTTQVQSLNLSNLTRATGIALDENIQRLYVSTVGDNNHYLDEYALGQTQQLVHVPSVNADNIAFGGHRFPFLFVPDYFGYDIQLYRPRAQKPFGSLSVTYNTQAVAYKPPHIP
jgi:hypothetical protein